MRDRFEEELARRAGGVRFAGRALPRIPGTSYLLIEGVSGMDVAASLDRLGIEVSTGSACHAGSPEPSAVLTAMGFARSAALGGVRVGFGHGNDDSQMERIVGAFVSTIERLRRESDA